VESHVETFDQKVLQHGQQLLFGGFEGVFCFRDHVKSLVPGRDPTSGRCESSAWMPWQLPLWPFGPGRLGLIEATSNAGCALPFRTIASARTTRNTMRHVPE